MVAWRHCDARTTSNGCFLCGEVAALLLAPFRCLSFSPSLIEHSHPTKDVYFQSVPKASSISIKISKWFYETIGSWLQSRTLTLTRPSWCYQSCRERPLLWRVALLTGDPGGGTKLGKYVIAVLKQSLLWWYQLKTVKPKTSCSFEVDC